MYWMHRTEIRREEEDIKVGEQWVAGGLKLRRKKKQKKKQKEKVSIREALLIKPGTNSLSFTS